MDLSFSLPPGPRVVEYARLGEEFGYSRLWLYDSPQLYADVWIALARVAESTSTLGIGPGVLVPGLRHVVTTAAAIGTLETLAPGRVAVAVGTGFTARRLLGKRPLPWSEVQTFVRALRGLLRGEVVTVDGESVQMIHPDGFAAPRPIATPILVAASGPKGTAVARAVGDGVMSIGDPCTGFRWCAIVQSGTVLAEGESFASARVFDALAPGIAVIYHSIYELQGNAVDQIPGGFAWRTEIERVPEAERHLHVHRGHCVEVPSHERSLLAPEVGSMTFTGTVAELRKRLSELESAGVTEFVYTPAGPDIPRELSQMAKALRIVK